MIPILFALAFPSVLTWLYFVALADQPSATQQGVYSVGKVVQFAFPAVWVFLVIGRPWPSRVLSPRGLVLGLLFGGLVGLGMWGIYALAMQPMGYFDGPALAIRAKVESTGLNSVVRYAALGCFYVVFHSLLEEYYWRWFVFGELRQRQSALVAVVVSSAGFMAHHVILLAVYFGWSSPLTYLFSLGVAVGGAVWAWLYERSGTLLAPWLSHALVDAAIFVIGFDVVRDQLR